ncbi:MAG: staygreen family protein [Turicibacter sp.]|nr:staygreen family protein [Turicibacter sp.]
MKTFNQNKLWTNYRLSNLNQIQSRRYTLTHSDETGELFLIIGVDFAYENFTPKRDELVGEWLRNNLGEYYFYVYVRVDGIDSSKSPTERNEIFIQELPLALSAIKHGDPYFFNCYPQFEQAPIYVFFQSRDPKLNRTECFGSFKDY